MSVNAIPINEIKPFRMIPINNSAPIVVLVDTSSFIQSVKVSFNALVTDSDLNRDNSSGY